MYSIRTYDAKGLCCGSYVPDVACEITKNVHRCI